MQKTPSIVDPSPTPDHQRRRGSLAINSAWSESRADWFLRSFVHPALSPLFNHLALPPQADSRVLVLGSGEGEIAEALRIGGWSSVGIDIDAGRSRSSRHRHPDCHIVRGDMASLPFQDGSFDAVLSYSALQYTDANATLEEVLRVLAPGGRAALTENLRQSPVPRMFRLLRGPMGFEKDPNQIPHRHVDWSWLRNLESRFSSVTLEAHHLLSPLALVAPTLRQATGGTNWTSPSPRLMNALSRMDRGLCARVPSLYRYCWFGVALCTK